MRVHLSYIISGNSGSNRNKINLDKCKAFRWVWQCTLGFYPTSSRQGWKVCSLCAQGFGHPEGESFWQGVLSSVLQASLGPTAITRQSIGMPSRSQLTSHSRLATVSLRAWAETHATWQSLKWFPLRTSRPSVKAQYRLVWAPCWGVLMKKEKSHQIHLRRDECRTNSESTVPGCTEYVVTPEPFSLRASSWVKRTLANLLLQ